MVSVKDVLESDEYTTINKLNDLIPRYITNKNEYESYKKLVNKDNKEIKKILAEIGKSEWQVGNNKVVAQERVTQTVNEDNLVEYLKSINATDCIKTIEVIDSDKLENAIYHGVITKEQVKEMQKFYTEKKTVALKLSRVKE